MFSLSELKNNQNFVPVTISFPTLKKEELQKDLIEQLSALNRVSFQTPTTPVDFWFLRVVKSLYREFEPNFCEYGEKERGIYTLDMYTKSNMGFRKGATDSYFIYYIRILQYLFAKANSGIMPSYAFFHKLITNYFASLPEKEDYNFIVEEYVKLYNDAVEQFNNGNAYLFNDALSKFSFIYYFDEEKMKASEFNNICTATGILNKNKYGKGLDVSFIVFTMQKKNEDAMDTGSIGVISRNNTVNFKNLAMTYPDFVASKSAGMNDALFGFLNDLDPNGLYIALSMLFASQKKQNKRK